MAEQFIGENINVFLKSPPNASLRGTVGGVSGQKLTLEDGMSIHS
jgi:hypothetical protein